MVSFGSVFLISNSYTMSIAENILKIKNNIKNNLVKIVAVSKYATIDQMNIAYNAGIYDFGESRIQDAKPKLDKMANLYSINWHFIGHVQSNKLNSIVGNFSLIHSIDSLDLLKKISDFACRKNITQSVLLQVKYDEKKYGFTENQLYAQFKEMLLLPNISIKGLMTIAPLTDDENVWAGCFNSLRNFKDKLIDEYKFNLSELSMGMSRDYMVAVACGATMIRLGSGIFDV